MTVGFDTSIIEQAMGAGLLEAVCIVGMVAFLIWSIKLALENDDENE